MTISMSTSDKAESHQTHAAVSPAVQPGKEVIPSTTTDAVRAPIRPGAELALGAGASQVPTAGRRAFCSCAAPVARYVGMGRGNGAGYCATCGRWLA